MALPLITDFSALPTGPVTWPLPGDWGHSYSPLGGFANISERYAREGTKCLEIGINNNGTNATYRGELSGDAPDGDGIPGITSGFVDGDEVWMFWSILCPPETAIASRIDTDAEVIFQYHSNLPEAGFALSPAVGLATENGRIVLDHRYTSVLNGDTSTQIVVANNADICGLNKGFWADIGVHLKMQHSAPGITEVYVNRMLKYRNITQPNSNNRSPGLTGYFKFGSYVPQRRDSATVPISDPRSNRKWYLSSFRGKAGATTTLAELSPETPLVLPDSAVALSRL